MVFKEDIVSALSHLFFPACMVILAFIVIAVPLIITISRKYVRHKKASNQQPEDKIVVGVFHPYCNSGGGGERVMWCAVRTLLNNYPNAMVYIYTGDLEASPEQILARTKNRLNIELPRKVEFIYLRRRKWVEASMYPYFTLLGQSLGSIILGVEALLSLVPDVYVDTMGYAFTYPLFKYIGECKVACYTHYPTITREMLRRVSSRVITHNNRRLVARSPFLTGMKLLYYRAFAKLYRCVGRCADIVMVNSSWTEEHINEIWKCPLKTHRVYPPCDVEHLKNMQLLPDIGEQEPRNEVKKEEDLSSTEKQLCKENENETVLITTADEDEMKEQEPQRKERLIKIISVGQFRPEKDHPLQLRAMYELRQLVPEMVWDKILLVFIGSCRNAEDDERVKDMRDLCMHLSLECNVEFRVNATFEELVKELQEGTVGLHSMWNEHFGMGVVECMAAGLIMVANRSGGPQMDIIEESEGSRNGFLAFDESEYARAIVAILKMTPQERNAIRVAARASVDRFSVEEFQKEFLRAMEPVMTTPKD